MGISQFLAEYITNFIDASGYISVYVLMVMESMVFPIPSEAVMPFAGFLIAQKEFTFAGVILISTLGSITGSLASYYIGMYGGKPFINRYGKYFLLNNEHLIQSENFFKRHGQKTIFISRFIPIIRHLISLPAGISRMNIFKFSIYTIIGAGMWNAFLAVVGYKLRQNWDSVMKYSEVLDIFVLGLIILGLGIFIYKHIKKWRITKRSL